MPAERDESLEPFSPSAQVLPMRREGGSADASPPPTDTDTGGEEAGGELVDTGPAESVSASEDTGDTEQAAPAEGTPARPPGDQPSDSPGPGVVAPTRALAWQTGRDSEGRTAGSGIPGPEDGPPPQYLGLISALEEECRRIVRTAEADAEQIRQSAEQYRASVVSEAHRASEAIVAAAERERDGILQAASNEITRWLDEFEQECRRWASRVRQEVEVTPDAGSAGAGPATGPH